MGKSTNSADRVRARDREAQALELRKAGATYAMIAERLEMSESGARKAVTRVLQRLIGTATESAEEVRRLELERLDAMLLAIAPQVRGGNLGAIDRALRIMERRAKMLGTDAPSKVAPTTPDGAEPWSLDGLSAAEVAAVRAEVERLMGKAEGL
jgi:DNA-binding CsgD family transcriptional regulator